jgi:glyoxylase-like metal-dependent hydrolase (beta-lactamase superfamily II)
MEVIRLEGTAWLACENGRGILIDAGMRADGAGILRRIRMRSIQVPLIFLTHTHYDHTGGLEALRQANGAQVMVDAKEAECIRQGFTPVPKGTSAFASFLSSMVHKLQSKKREGYVPVTRDIVEAGEEGSLEAYGFDARYMHLGGHTAGSSGLLVGEYFFAGDTVFNIGRGHYPPFADFPEDIPAAWRIIIGSGAKHICPGHGRMLGMDKLKKEFERRFGTCV